MSPLYGNLPVIQNNESFSFNNRTYRFSPEKWYGKKIFFVVKGNGALDVKELNLFERCLRYLRIAYQSTRLAHLKKDIDIQNHTFQSSKGNPVSKQIVEILRQKKIFLDNQVLEKKKIEEYNKLLKETSTDAKFQETFENRLLLGSYTELMNDANLERYLDMKHPTRDATIDFFIKALLITAIYRSDCSKQAPKENNDSLSKLLDKMRDNPSLPPLLKKKCTKALLESIHQQIPQLMQEPLRKLVEVLCIEKLGSQDKYTLGKIPDETLEEWLRFHLTTIAMIACPS